MRRKSVAYIAGKITGDRNYKTKFADAQEGLERHGYIVLNPSWMPQGLANEQYMRMCFAMIDSADDVFMLDDWKDSEGARLEYEYCMYQRNSPVLLSEWLRGMERIAQNK